MSDFSATFALNRGVLANTGGTSIAISCAENGRKLRHKAAKAIRHRAKETPGSGNASCTCKPHGRRSSAAECRRCR